MNLFTSAIASTVLAVTALSTTAASASTPVRVDGITFDSDVGAACGALSTDVLFEPWSTRVDALDEPLLDFIAECMTYGALADARVAVIGLGDESFLSPSGEELASERMNAVVTELLERGVDVRQIEPWALAVDWRGGQDKPDRVVFRILEGAPSWLAR